MSLTTIWRIQGRYILALAIAAWVIWRYGGDQQGTPDEPTAQRQPNITEVDFEAQHAQERAESA